MRVISCLVEDHNLWLVLLAAVVCVIGCFVTMRLLDRAIRTEGLQRTGWICQTAAAAGASVWCTHFVAILAYDPKTPVDFDPILTIASLGLAIFGFGLAFGVLANSTRVWTTVVGGMMVGVTVSVMHYTGMAAYHISGVVEWSAVYVAASVVLSVLMAAAALSIGMRVEQRISWYAAPLALVLAIVSLHFTGMAAVSVTPLASGVTNAVVFQSMAVAIAGVSLFIVATGVACHMIDTRSRTENTLRLREMALSDALTGLPNRTSFADRLDNDLVAAARDGHRLAVVGIDLNRFKEINDFRGHRAGDQALEIIATRLRRCLRRGEFVARVGGDEFSALKIFDQQNDLLDFVSRLEAALFEPLQVDDFIAQAGASIGVAVFPNDGKTPETLIGNADLAMYRAKADPGKAICFYESNLDAAARERQVLARDLRRAIELEQFELHFQVQVSVATAAACGYEVLLRWRHPERGMVPPMEFIPLAEENGAIIEIGEWVLREACRRAVSWKEPHKIAVNLSAIQLAQKELPRLVHEILIETGLSPTRLELEITETAIVTDKARALHVLRQIRAFGVTIALDDFGTGYSSLDTLRSFPFDKIKLDRLFMKEVETNPQSKAIVRAVLALGKSLDVPILAEGVETADQLELLRREGCDEAQGYLLGRPQPDDGMSKREFSDVLSRSATSVDARQKVA
jgi:diguanylate cyclase (GGDEF)-like protein